MKTKKDALKKQEAAMLKQFNVEELEERLEMKLWDKSPGGSGPLEGFTQLL